MRKIRKQTTIHTGRENKKKASIKEHNGKYYVLSSIASAYNTIFIEGKEYTEVKCLGFNTDNEFWAVV